jgi:hypothetical protein
MEENVGPGPAQENPGRPVGVWGLWAGKAVGGVLVGFRIAHKRAQGASGGMGRRGMGGSMGKNFVLDASGGVWERLWRWAGLG